MNHLRTALARSRDTHARHRAERASVRDEREFRRIVAAAPTRESAHELASLFARR
jgi:hypothetical protein